MTTAWKVRGLYSPPATYEGCTEAEARERYHQQYPGWAGVILSVKPAAKGEGQ